jgi:predicted HTH domain antitoxin
VTHAARAIGYALRMAQVDVPDELLEALARSKLGQCEPADRVRVAAAVTLHQAEAVTIGEAAHLAGMGYVAFWDLLVELGLPAFKYGLEEYEQDMRAIEARERRRKE